LTGLLFTWSTRPARTVDLRASEGGLAAKLPIDPHVGKEMLVLTSLRFSA
jgi:hypothetical protein